MLHAEPHSLGLMTEIDPKSRFQILWEVILQRMGESFCPEEGGVRLKAAGCPPPSLAVWLPLGFLWAGGLGGSEKWLVLGSGSFSITA